MNLEVKELRQGMLLSGVPGLPMLEDAINFAKEYLGTDNLDRHPDYLYVHQMPKKKSIGVEEVALINRKAALKPSLAKKQIIIIDGIDSMTEAAQNKILKILEDYDAMVIIIAIAYSERVLATIKSRVVIYEYRHLGFVEFADAMKQYPNLSPDIYYLLSYGCINLVEDLAEYDDVFCSIVRVIDTGNYPELLQTMSLLKEKDSNAITNTPYIKNVLHLICACFSEKMMLLCGQDGKLMTSPVKGTIKNYENICHMIGGHLMRCMDRGYKKDNFFSLIVYIIEEMNGAEGGI